MPNEKEAEAVMIVAELGATAQIAREKRWEKSMRLLTSGSLRVSPYVLLSATLGASLLAPAAVPVLALATAAFALATVQEQTRALAGMVAQLREELDSLGK